MSKENMPHEYPTASTSPQNRDRLRRGCDGAAGQLSQDGITSVTGMDNAPSRAMPEGVSLRIAHVLCTFDLGGAESVALALARHQRALGHVVTVISLRAYPEGVLREEFAAGGMETLTIARRDGFDPSVSPRLAALLARRGTHLVHTHNYQPLIYGGLAGWMARIPVVHTKHGVAADGTRRKWVSAVAGRFPDAFVAVSEDTAGVAVARGAVSRKRLQVLPNGVDTDAIRPRPERRGSARRRLAIPDGGLVIGTVGRLQPVKNHRMLVEAAAPLLPRHGAHLVLVGTGDEEDQLRELVSRLRVERWVVFAGQRRDMAEILPAFDVFALPSRSEGHPLAAVEAMAAGLPVVATAVGGVPELVHDRVTGLLSAEGDVGAFRRSLSLLLEDRGLAARLGHEARAAIERDYSVARMGTRYLTLYADVLRARHGRGFAMPRGAADPAPYEA
jgi:glycosyltransferase involved in cell wall biosynthesis